MQTRIIFALWLSAAATMTTGTAHAQANATLDQLGPAAILAGDAGSGVPALAGVNSFVGVQSGNFNQAYSTMSGVGTITGNSLQQTQLGNGNSLQATQQGALNSLTQTQIGNNNPMSATQVGVGNTLTAQQYGNNTTGLGVTQYGGAHATVTQSR